MGGNACGCQSCREAHTESYADTLARRYTCSITIQWLTGICVVIAALLGLAAAIQTGNKWWMAAVALPAIPFYAGYLYYRREDARNWDTVREMAAEREDWCTCFTCGLNRNKALDAPHLLEYWAPNSGVDDIKNNTPAGRRFRAAAAAGPPRVCA